MKNRKQKQHDDEIEAEVLDRLRVASAWEVLPSVPPSSSPRPEWALREKHLRRTLRME
ncbi:MAG: hypothetical protein M3P06_20300 [Acidobacteriota bacterium]|nr:hypothetical protein [Acidobacteriota bacterium]